MPTIEVGGCTMPHPGTHIAALRLLASDPVLSAALGGTSAERLAAGDEAMVLRHRYACFGALGPDLLYFMLDGGPWTQGAQNLVIRLLATKRAFGRVVDEVGDLGRDALDAAGTLDPCNILGLIEDGVGELSDVLDLGMGILANGLKALATDGLGLNLFSILTSPRQAGEPPSKWYWADHLHYERTGAFARNLLDLACLDPRFKDHAPLRAYALGYLTHVIGDVIGHPYVNQIVGGPYRLHRQRHTLVENFIDGWAWRHTHKAKEGDNGMTGRPFLDQVQPNEAACGSANNAFFHRCRLDEFLDVGPGQGFLPGVESLMDDFAEALDSVDDLMFRSDVPEIRDEAMFDRWTELFLAALRQTYDAEPDRPKLLAGDGYPTKQDLATAYATALMILGSQTGEAIEEPEFPDLSGVEDAAKKFLDDLLAALEAALDALSLPVPDISGSFSLEALFSALVDWVKAVFEAALAIIAGVLDLLRSLCQLGTAITGAIILIAFYFIKKALWAAWSALRRILELRAYDQPLPDTVDEHRELWEARSNATRRDDYPVMELRSGNSLPKPPSDPGVTKIQQDQLFTSLEPQADPAKLPHHVERPAVAAIGQEFPLTDDSEFPSAATPHALMFRMRGSGVDDMFSSSGFVAPNEAAAKNPVARAYGGIVPNCRHALAAILNEAQKSGITTVIPASLTLHDFNLDGDRGLGWLAWELASGQHRPAANIDAVISTKAWS